MKDGKSLFLNRHYYSVDYPDRIFLDYSFNQSMTKYLTSNKRFVSLQTKLFFIYQISISLQFLRDFGIIHNDIKPQNYLTRIMADRRRENTTILLRLIDFS